MAQNDIGIDLGTTTIIIAQEGKGVVLNQPSVVAMDTRKNSVLEAGDKALAMVGRTPNYISAIFPLKDGVISDHTMTRELICRFVKQVYSSHMVKPRVAVCVPAAITGIESDAVVEAVVAAGARQVYLIDEPIAAALGSGIDITQPDGRMIIDIGGGTTDIAVLSLGGKVKATSVRVAGNHYDEEILKHVRNKYSIAIGQRTEPGLEHIQFLEAQALAHDRVIAALDLFLTPDLVALQLPAAPLHRLLRLNHDALGGTKGILGRILPVFAHLKQWSQRILFHAQATTLYSACNVSSKVLFSSKPCLRNAFTALIRASASSASLSDPFLYSPICTSNSTSANFASTLRSACAAFLCSFVTMAFITRLTLACTSMAG